MGNRGNIKITGAGPHPIYLYTHIENNTSCDFYGEATHEQSHTQYT